MQKVPDIQTIIMAQIVGGAMLIVVLGAVATALRFLKPYMEPRRD